MSEWKDYKLGEVVTFQRGFDITSKDLIDGIYPIVSSSGTTAWHNQFKVRQPGVVIGRKGTLGKVYYLAHDYWPHDTTLWVKDFHGNYPLFIYYFLKTLGLGEYDVGSSNPTLNRNHIHLLPVSVPNLKIQKDIAKTLSSLDDKIDLLHRQNKTLEAMAETLFRQWFVEEAEESWEVGKLGDVLSVKGGTTPSTAIPEFWDGNINWTTPKDLSNHHGIYMFRTERKITELGLSKIGSGQLSIGTVLLSSRAPIGYLAINEIPVAINQGYIAILCNKGLSNYFVYSWCKANLEEIKNSGNGSVFQEISKTTFKDLSIVIPPVNKLKDFDSVIEPTFQKIKNNQIQIESLTQMRDSLLPKLMSGEIKVNCCQYGFVE